MKSKWFDRVVAVILIFTLALISPMQFVRSDAATKSVKYIKEFKLFVPVTIQYGWGIITTDEPIEVLVETTIKDGE